MLALAWLGWPIVIVALAAEALYSHLPTAALALALAYLPANASGNLTLTNARTKFGLRAGLDLLSGLALIAVLVTQHSALPVWLVAIASVFAVLCLGSAVIALLAWRQRKRARLE